MKKNYLLLVFLILIASFSTFAQGYTSQTGDSELDASLKNININAHADLKLFKKDLSVNFNISEGKLDQLMVAYNLQPADLYMVLEIGKIINRPFEEIGDCYQKNHGKGWGVIAKEMGIKPGSKEFHMLKDQAKGKSKKNKNKSKGNKGSGHGNSGNGKNKGKKNK